MGGHEGVDGRAVELHVLAERLDEVVAVLEGARLETVAEECDILVGEGLHDEVGDHAPVLRVHVGPVGVEDAHHAHVHAVLAAVVGAEGLGAALALVVAGSDADRVDVAPVGLQLRVHERVAVHLARGGVEHACLRLEGEVEHVHHAEHGALRGLHGVLLVVDGRGGAGEVVDLVELPPEGLGHVVQDERELGIAEEVVDVGLRAGEEVVERRHLVAVRQQAAAEVRAEEAGGAGHERFFREDHVFSFAVTRQSIPHRAPSRNLPLAERAGLCYTLVHRARSRAVTPEGDKMVQKEKTERAARMTGEEA